MIYIFSYFSSQSLSSVFSSQFSPPPSLYLLTVFLLSVISFLLPLHHVAQLYFFMHALVYSMNIPIRWCCWDPFLYGALTLYSWPWRHILRCVMMEESCPTTWGYGGNNICCVCISWNEPVSHARDDTLTKKKRKEKKDIGSVCDSQWFLII